METGPVDRIRGIAFVLSALLAAGLSIYILVSPGAFRSIHPIPMLLLLLLTLVVSVWQALAHLR